MIKETKGELTMNISYMNKRVKTCTVTIKSFNAPIIPFEKPKNSATTKVFKGNKNSVLKELKEYLKFVSFHKPTLSQIMDEVNKTSDLYLDHPTGNGWFGATFSAYNSETGISYVLSIKYELNRLPKKVDKTKCNNHGENIYQKRLCQRYGGELILRYETACNKIKFSKLLELIKEPIMSELVKKVATRSVYKEYKLEITTPEEVELVTGDIKIGVRFFDTYRNYRFGSAGVLGMEVLLAVSYHDKQIYEPSIKPDVFTEEIVKDMEEQAEMFEKVLDIIKEECQK